MLYCKDPHKTAIELRQKTGFVMGMYRFYNGLNLRQRCL